MDAGLLIRLAVGSACGCETISFVADVRQHLADIFGICDMTEIFGVVDGVHLLIYQDELLGRLLLRHQRSTIVRIAEM